MIQEKGWILNPKAQEADLLKIEAAFPGGVPSYMAQLMAQRGLLSESEIRNFFNPDLANLHSPWLMKDMDIATNRLQQAKLKNEKVLVYGDYDVDGTSAVALVFRFLKGAGLDVAYYLPDRYLEGYGISNQGIEFAREGSFSLIIALDCGIKAHEQALLASNDGIDLIVCDHHLPDQELPKALAVLDPKRTDCDYPFKELTGNGIGFKLCQALCEVWDIPFERLLEWIELTAISIASDIVPIVGENRILASAGLKKVNSKPMIGIEALLKNGPKKLWYDVSDLVFIIGPRINAAGRMGHGSEAVALLITDDAETATSLALAIEERNKARKETDRKITREALVKLKETADWEIKNSTVVYSADWHKGVVGIVASRVIEVHYRPTIVLCENQGKLTGSARSVAGFNLYDALEVCSPLLEQFGGHHFAAGLSLKPEHLDAFIEMFEASVSERITPEHLIPKIHYDLEIELGEITSGFIKNIARFGPFGPGNMMPVFRLNNLVDRGMARIVGENHLSFYAENGKGKGFKAIAFGQGARLDLIKNGAAFDLLCTLEEQTFNGKTSIQLMVMDIKPSV